MPSSSYPSPSHIHSRTVVDYQVSLPIGRVSGDVNRFDDLGRALDESLSCMLAGSGFSVKISRFAILDGSYLHLLRLERGAFTYFQQTRGELRCGAVRGICTKTLRFVPALRRVPTERLRFDPLTRGFKIVKI